MRFSHYSAIRLNVLPMSREVPAARSTAYKPEHESRRELHSSPESERLLAIYRKSGMKALLDELSRF